MLSKYLPILKQKEIDCLKGYMTLKMKRDGPTCSPEKDCSSHLYDSNLFKSIDSWTYVLYRKDCSSHLYDSELLYIVLVCGPTCSAEKTVVATSMIP